MLFAVALICAAKLAWLGTVPVASNAFNDRLHSAYIWSVLSIACMGAYVGWVAWLLRSNVAIDQSPTQIGG